MNPPDLAAIKAEPILVFRYDREAEDFTQSFEGAGDLVLDGALVLAAARKGDAQVLDWAIETFRGAFLQDARLVLRAFCEACASGHLPAAQLLAQRCHLAARCSERRGLVLRALWRACAGGHLGIVAWMKDEFHLTQGDIRCDDTMALFVACVGGHAAVIGWLASAYGFAAADVRAQGSRALEALCRGGTWWVADWLVANYGLTAGDARAGLRGAFMGAQVGVMHWLVALLDARVNVGGLGAARPAPVPPGVDASVFAAGARWAARLAAEPSDKRLL